jgi:prolyl oligopeptidase
VSLSKGGGDAVVVKEFDVDSKSFIENGFTCPKPKVAPVGLMKIR